MQLTVRMSRYAPFRAGCHIPLPAEVQKKKAVINIKCSDHACFFWSVVAILHPVANPRVHNVCRTSSYPDYNTVLDTSGIQLPITLKQINTFERNNNNISINVFGWEQKRCVPLRLTARKQDRHVNLLLIESSPDSRTHEHHYAAISNLSRLVSSQISKKAHARYICER